MKGFDEYYDEAVEPGKRERAFAWATAIGLQDVDHLRVSSFLVETAIRHINGEITQEQAREIIEAQRRLKRGIRQHKKKAVRKPWTRFGSCCVISRT